MRCWNTPFDLYLFFYGVKGAPTRERPKKGASNMSGLGRTIKSLRVAAGIRQGDLANRVGVTQAYLSALEAGKRTPSLALVERISSVLRVPAGALLSCSTPADDLPSKYAELYTRLQDLQELFLRLLVVEAGNREEAFRSEA